MIVLYNTNMATILVEKNPSHPFDAIAVDIETRYEGIVTVVRERKEILLIRLSEFRQEYNSLLSNRDKTERELKQTKEHIETIKENDLKTMQQEILAKIEDKMQNLQISTSNYFIRFDCVSEELERKLSQLGELVKVDYKLPNYPEMVTPVVAVGKKGNGKDQLNGPRGIAFDEENQLIYVCDLGSLRVKIVSLRGEFISEFGRNVLDRPWGILICKDSIYVTDVRKCAIFQFHLTTNELVQKVGKKGSGKGEFNIPKSLALGPDNDLYVAEDDNNRISVIDLNLNFKRFIQHKMIRTPVDVKFCQENILVLSKSTEPHIHILDLAGEYIKSIISLKSSISWFFCIDGSNNILISDKANDLIQIFDQDGILLDIIGKEGQFKSPYGITTTRNGQLIAVRENESHGLQIF